mgnify:FL=1
MKSRKGERSSQEVIKCMKTFSLITSKFSELARLGHFVKNYYKKINIHILWRVKDGVNERGVTLEVRNLLSRKFMKFNAF